MSCRSLSLALAAQLLLVPAQLIAGGPPWLCLPIVGVTPENAPACAKLIDKRLADKLWQHSGPYCGGAVIRQDGDQHYLTFYMQEDVELGEIEAVLKGSEFSIPRDRLRLFGHVILKVDAHKASRQELLASLEALDQVSVAESKDENDVFLVTAQMPYPVVKDRPKPEAIGWTKFAWNDYAAAESKGSEPPASREELPGFDTLRDVIAKHNARLKDIRWSTTHACRALGCVSTAGSRGEIAAISGQPPLSKD
jgi:hypothetical protein